MNASSPQSSLDQGFAAAVTMSLTLPATLLDLYVSAVIGQLVDPNYPLAVHLPMRVITGPALALLLGRTWPGMRMVAACFLAMFAGVLSVGGDVYFSKTLCWFWPKGFGTPCLPLLRWSGGTFWLLHFVLAALAVQSIIQRRRSRNRK